MFEVFGNVLKITSRTEYGQPTTTWVSGSTTLSAVSGERGGVRGSRYSKQIANYYTSLEIDAIPERKNQSSSAGCNNFARSIS
jgi:hypothetical protein